MKMMKNEEDAKQNERSPKLKGQFEEMGLLLGEPGEVRVYMFGDTVLDCQLVARKVENEQAEVKSGGTEDAEFVGS